MPADPVLKLDLKVAKPPEPQSSWEQSNAGRSPYDLALFLQTMLFVDAGAFAKLTGVVRQSAQPQPQDTNKLWLKTSDPVGVGIYSGGWQLIYQFPAYTPFLWDISKRGAVPVYCVAMSDTEIAAAGLGVPTNTNYQWVIFNPPTFR